MKSKSIYLIIGRTGEYADQCEWNVCWFSDRKTAEAFADAPHLRERLERMLGRALTERSE